MAQKPYELRLRPGTEADLPFLRRVHREAMRPHVEATWGTWDDAAQYKRFLESTDPCAHDIVERDGVAIGCRWVREHPGEWELVRIYLLASAQGQGVGTELIGRLCADARAAGKVVRLRVLRTNPAQRLYRRLGFAISGETESHLEMRWEGEA